MAKDISRENAQQIAVDYMRQMKNVARIDVAAVEHEHAEWVIRGTFPIDMQGHPWAQKFEVVVDANGKIKRTHSSLL